jgi:hypothetical protein
MYSRIALAVLLIPVLASAATFDALLTLQSPTAAHSSQLAISAGDTLDLAVGIGPDSSYEGDTTDVTATNSAVPLPGGLWFSRQVSWHLAAAWPSDAAERCL